MTAAANNAANPPQPSPAAGIRCTDIVLRCAALDGQCAAAWCDCERYQRAAIKYGGNISAIMLDQRCAWSTAKKASDWYAQNDKLCREQGGKDSDGK